MTSSLKMAQDATAHQVGCMRPEFKGDLLQMEVRNHQGTRQEPGSPDGHAAATTDTRFQ